MKKFNFSRAIIPNSFTASNLFCGFVSIVFASQQEFLLSAYFIIIAAIFDLTDGLMARLLGTSSEFGVQLDSLSDVVSFGAAPSFLIYSAFLFHYDFLGVVISSLLLVFGCFRLARFNVQIEDLTNKADFRGLPIPVSAITISSFIIMFHPHGMPEFPFTYIVIPMILLLSFLMVSNIKYSAFPKLTFKSLKEKPQIPILFALGIIIIVIFQFQGLFLIFISIVLFGIFRHIIVKLTKSYNDQKVSLNKD